jgi:predicted DNA-binding protein (MmcQ/YjbR family)
VAGPASRPVFERPVFARARRLCLSFPEATEKVSWGHPNFRAGRKTFCAFELVKGRPSIAFRLPPADVDVACRRPDFFATPYGRGVWASVWVVGAIDWSTIERLLQRSFRAVATKRQLRLLEPGGDP